MVINEKIDIIGTGFGTYVPVCSKIKYDICTKITGMVDTVSDNLDNHWFGRNRIWQLELSLLSVDGRSRVPVDATVCLHLHWRMQTMRGCSAGRWWTARLRSDQREKAALHLTALRQTMLHLMALRQRAAQAPGTSSPAAAETAASGTSAAASAEGERCDADQQQVWRELQVWQLLPLPEEWLLSAGRASLARYPPAQPGTPQGIPAQEEQAHQPSWTCGQNKRRILSAGEPCSTRSCRFRRWSSAVKKNVVQVAYQYRYYLIRSRIAIQYLYPEPDPIPDLGITLSLGFISVFRIRIRMEPHKEMPSGSGSAWTDADPKVKKPRKCTGSLGESGTGRIKVKIL